MVTVKFVKQHPDARLPEKNHSNSLTGDAGFDLFAVEETVIQPGSSAVVPVGIALGGITPGYWFKIEARSGLGFKHSLQPHFGIIDNGYRGNLGVKIYNLSNETKVISKGQGCAQFIVYEMIPTIATWTENPDDTERGDKGFGSSDKP